MLFIPLHQTAEPHTSIGSPIKVCALSHSTVILVAWSGQSAPNMTRQRSRSFSFTLNNYTEEEIKDILACLEGIEARYVGGSPPPYVLQSH